MKNNKLMIGMDLDNTLIDTSHRVSKVASLNTGIKAPKITDWYFSNFPDELKEEIYKLFKDDEFMSYDAFTWYKAVATLRKWKKQGHKIIIITARDKSIHESTKQMVDVLFHKLIDKICFVGINKSKKDVMKREKIDLWIDDSPWGVLDSCSLGIKTYLIHNKYTKNYNSFVLEKNLPIIPVKVISEVIL